MRKFLLATLSAAALGFASQSVLATDVAVDPAAYDWSGPYVGLQVGYGFGESRHTVGVATSGDFTIDGILGGVTAGWNHQADALVFGIEGDISAADIAGQDNICIESCESGIDWLGTARLRAGFAMDSLLLFASGGLAVGGVNAEFDNGAGGGSSGDETNFGWTIGAGAEWGATDSLSFKVEYLFVDLDSFEYGPGPTEVEFNQNHIIRAGLNWHF
jgi:outer membrane immunogenic protein